MNGMIHQDLSEKISAERTYRFTYPLSRLPNNTFWGKILDFISYYRFGLISILREE